MPGTTGSMKNRLFWFCAVGIALLSVVLAQRVARGHWLAFNAVQFAHSLEPAEMPTSAPELASPPPTKASATPDQIPLHHEQLCRGVRLLDIESTADGHLLGAWLSHDTLGLQLVTVGGALGNFTLTRVYEKEGDAQAWLSSHDGSCRVVVQPSQGAKLVASKATASLAPTSRMNSDAIDPTAPAKSIMADTDRARMRLVNQILKQSLSR